MSVSLAYVSVFSLGKRHTLSKGYNSCHCELRLSERLHTLKKATIKSNEC